MKKIGLLLLLATPMLTSCWNLEEMDKMNYIHSIGIDYKEGHFIIYAQIVNFSYLSKEVGPPPEEKPVIVGIGTGRTVLEAVSRVYRSTSRRLFWGHLSSIVFSKEGLEKGMQQTIDLFTRYHETRHTSWIYVTRAPLKDLMTIITPTGIESIYTKLGEPRESNKQTTFSTPIEMFKFNREIYEPGNTVLVPELSIDKNHWFDKEKAHSALRINSCGVMTKKSFYGFLSESQMRGTLFQQSKRIFIYVKAGKDKYISMNVLNPKMKVIPSYKNGNAVFDINVKIKGVLEELDTKASLTDIQKNAIKEVRKEIVNSYLTGLSQKADVFQLSYSFYKKYPLIWRKIQSDEMVPLSSDSIHVNVDLRVDNSYKIKNQPFLSNVDEGG